MLRGTIYKITSSATPKIYIGSTIQPLHKRMQRHKYNYTKNESCTSKLILQYEDAKIEELHILECESIKELRDKEREFVMLHKDIAVNKHLLDTKQNIHKKAVNKYDKKMMELNLNFSKEHYEKYKEYQRAYCKTEEHKAKRRELYKLKKNIQIN